MEDVYKYQFIEKLIKENKLIGDKLDNNTFKCKVNNNLIIRCYISLQDIENAIMGKTLKHDEKVYSYVYFNNKYYLILEKK